MREREKIVALIALVQMHILIALKIGIHYYYCISLTQRNSPV